MNKIDVVSKILNENESEILKTESELNHMIDCELSRSNKSKDYALMDELIKGAIESRDDSLKFVDTEKMLGKFKVKQKKDNIKRKSRFKRWAAGVVSVFLLVMLFSNAYTVSAYNKSAFSMFIEFIDSGGVNADLPAHNAGNEACSHYYSTHVQCGEYRGTTSVTHVYSVTEYGRQTMKTCQVTIMLKRHAVCCYNCGNTLNEFDGGSPCTKTHLDCPEGTKSCH